MGEQEGEHNDDIDGNHVHDFALFAFPFLSTCPSKTDLGLSLGNAQRRGEILGPPIIPFSTTTDMISTDGFRGRGTGMSFFNDRDIRNGRYKAHSSFLLFDTE